VRRKGIEVSGEQEARGQWSGEGRNKRWVQVKNEREEGGEGRRRRGKKAEREEDGEGRRRRRKEAEREEGGEKRGCSVG